MQYNKLKRVLALGSFSVLMTGFVAYKSNVEGLDEPVLRAGQQPLAGALPVDSPEAKKGAVLSEKKGPMQMDSAERETMRRRLLMSTSKSIVMFTPTAPAPVTPVKIAPRPDTAKLIRIK